jgi:hypothetical protein
MSGERTVREIVVELNPQRTTVWRARVDALEVVVVGDTIIDAEARAIAAVVETGAQIADDVLVRVRFGTRAQRLAAGWTPSSRPTFGNALTVAQQHLSRREETP